MNFFGIEIGVNCNASGFKQGLDTARKELANFGASVTTKLLGAGAFAAIGAYIVDSARKALKDVSEIKIGRLKTGIDDVEKFQQIRNAFEAAGLDADSYAKAVGHIAEKMAEVKEGGVAGAKAQREFAELGVTLDNLAKKDRHQIFKQIGDDMHEAAREAKITDDQLNALKKVFSKEAINLIPVFERGSDNNVDSLGVKSEEEVKSLQKVNRAIGENKALWKELSATIGGFAATKGLDNYTLGLLPLVRALFVPRKPASLEKSADDLQASDRAKRMALANEQAKLAEAAADEQSRREQIGQLNAQRDESLDKTLTKEQQLARIQQRRLEIAEAMSKLRHIEGFVGEDDVKKAQLEASLAELDAQEGALEKAGKPKGLHSAQPLSDLQKIGAQINTPKAKDAAPDIVRNTARTNEILLRQGISLAGIKGAIERKASTFED